MPDGEVSHYLERGLRHRWHGPATPCYSTPSPGSVLTKTARSESGLSPRSVNNCSDARFCQRAIRIVRLEALRKSATTIASRSGHALQRVLTGLGNGTGNLIFFLVLQLSPRSLFHFLSNARSRRALLYAGG